MESDTLKECVSAGVPIFTQIPNLNRLVSIKTKSSSISHIKVGTIIVDQEFFVGDKESF